MTTILCFGDSNTWGYIPGTGARFGLETRWPGLLRKALGAEYHIIEEGLCGRTTAFDDPCSPDRNGAAHLPMLLDTHAPLDRIVIMLGTNDLKHHLGLSAHDIAIGAGFLIDLVAARAPGTEVLLVCPPPVAPTPNPFGHTFAGAVAKSAGLAGAYREIAEEKGVRFTDAGAVIACPDTDGIHLDAANHAALAAHLAEVLGGGRV